MVVLSYRGVGSTTKPREYSATSLRFSARGRSGSPDRRNVFAPEPRSSQESDICALLSPRLGQASAGLIVSRGRNLERARFY